MDKEFKNISAEETFKNAGFDHAVIDDKFKGRPRWVRYFYNMGNEEADEVLNADDGTPIDVFFITAQEKERFPALKRECVAAFWLNSLGRVEYRLFSDDDVEAAYKLHMTERGNK